MRKGAMRERNTSEEDDVRNKPPQEEEYFEEKRNLEDLWKVAFPVGTEFEHLDALYRFNWDFKNLEEALEEGGFLHERKVYVFGFAEPQHFVDDKEQEHLINVPTVVVIDSTIEPSNKVAIASIQSAREETITMKEMRMGWFPYIPLQERDKQVERTNSRIFTLCCNQRRAALRNMKVERVKKFEYCLPYFFKPGREEDEIPQSTVVDVLFPSDPPVYCVFDWELDNLEEFTNQRIEEEVLSVEQKDEFKEFVKESVRAARRANREARDARRREVEEMSQETRQVFENMKVYKFYPQNSPDFARNMQKNRFINRYYGNAHQFL
ncbi:unnamed protein product [Eruca vesicaria subsp. sativa]|uniref:Uncharacterized protein n=1 Tax=Eruca vesicaria subsp. sativa TaxID=29727 RepID=A0ABC8LUM2_ERUVS|nr:unnamed protein product [Eruca vesicaria subsp. sativa]